MPRKVIATKGQKNIPKIKTNYEKRKVTVGLTATASGKLL